MDEFKKVAILLAAASLSSATCKLLNNSESTSVEYFDSLEADMDPLVGYTLKRERKKKKRGKKRRGRKKGCEKVKKFFFFYIKQLLLQSHRSQPKKKKNFPQLNFFYIVLLLNAYSYVTQ